jgi:hypothetical protein
MTVVAARFGWAAVADGPMDWPHYAAALQLLAEERVGTALRAQQADEDAAFTAARSRIRG